MRVIYSLATDRQTAIYWGINHFLARLYFESNKQEMTKTQEHSSDVLSVPPLHEKKARQELP